MHCSNLYPSHSCFKSIYRLSVDGNRKTVKVEAIAGPVMIETSEYFTVHSDSLAFGRGRRYHRQNTLDGDVKEERLKRCPPHPPQDASHV